MKSAFDRFYQDGHKPSDAIDLAISDAIHNKLGEFVDALVKYRDDHDKALRAIEQATEGATEGCGIFEAVCVLISQRDNAHHYADTFRKRLKELGEDYC